MSVTSESTLEELVDETTVIKNELVVCRDNLKNNLSNKGVDVSTTDKMQGLVEKVNDLQKIIIEYSKPFMLLIDVNNGGVIFEYDCDSMAFIRSKKCAPSSGYERQYLSKVFKNEIKLLTVVKDKKDIYLVRYSDLTEKHIGSLPDSLSDSTLRYVKYDYGFKGYFHVYSENKMYEVDLDTFIITNTFALSTAIPYRLCYAFDKKSNKTRMFGIEGRFVDGKSVTTISELDMKSFSIIRSKVITYISNTNYGLDCLYDELSNKLRIFGVFDAYGKGYDDIIEISPDSFEFVKSGNTSNGYYSTNTMSLGQNCSIYYKGEKWSISDI